MVISKLIIPIFIIAAVISLMVMGMWFFFQLLSNPLGIALVAAPLLVFAVLSPGFVRLEPLKKYQKSMEARKAGIEYSDNLTALDFEEDTSSPDSSMQFKINSDLFNQIKSSRSTSKEQADSKEIVSSSKPVREQAPPRPAQQPVTPQPVTPQPARQPATAQPARPQAAPQPARQQTAAQPAKPQAEAQPVKPQAEGSLPAQEESFVPVIQNVRSDHGGSSSSPLKRVKKEGSRLNRTKSPEPAARHAAPSDEPAARHAAPAGEPAARHAAEKSSGDAKSGLRRLLKPREDKEKKKAEKEKKTTNRYSGNRRF